MSQHHDIRDEDHQPESRDFETHELQEGKNSYQDGSSKGKRKSFLDARRFLHQGHMRTTSDESSNNQEKRNVVYKSTSEKVRTEEVTSKTKRKGKVGRNLPTVGVKEKDFELVVTRITLEGFNTIHWEWWERSTGYLQEFSSFKIHVFEAMAWIVLILYDDEDLSALESQDVLYPNSLEYDEKDLESYVEYTREVIEGNCKCKDIIKEEAIKRHFLIEQNDCKCFCIIDALYMESWKKIPIKSLKSMISAKLLEFLASNIHDALYEFAMTRIRTLHKCVSSVTQTLSEFGSFDPDVHNVMERAELERRTQGHKFISTDDLLTSICQMMLGDSLPCGRITSKYSLQSDKDRLDRLYTKSKSIAMNRGDSMTRLEHLYQALIDTGIVSGTWKDLVELVTVIKSQNKPNDTEASAGTELWKAALKNSDGTREIKNGVFDVVEKIQDGRDFLDQVAKKVKKVKKFVYGNQCLTIQQVLSESSVLKEKEATNTSTESQNLSYDRHRMAFKKDYSPPLENTVAVKKIYSLRSRENSSLYITNI